MWNMRWGPPLSVPIPRSTTFFCHNGPKNLESLTEKPCNFIGLLLLNLLIIQSFKEDVHDQYIFSAERTEKSNRVYFWWYYVTLNVSHISCVTIFHYCYIEGERWRPRSCYATVHPSINRKKGKKANRLLPNNTHPIYCSVLLNFLARYLADALLGILTMDSSLP